MTIIAELTIASEEFLLGQVLSRYTETHIEMERIVPASGAVMPYVWVEGDDLDSFERVVQESDHVENLAVLDRFETEGLYRVEWADEVESLINGISRTNATIIEARGNDKWTFRLRFQDHSGLAQFHNYCSIHDISFTLERLYTLDQLKKEGHALDLTATQRNALVMAVERGYFEVPRRVTLGELADDLEVAQQTVSENLRRGADKVLRSVLLSQTKVTSE
jgi:predicted DNA binding protein